MNGSFTWDRFASLPIVGILRRFPADVVRHAALAAQRGGLTTLEITIDTPAAFSILAMLRKTVGATMNIGAGTVCTLADLQNARAAGAEFIVTPVVVSEVIRTAKAYGLPVFAGAYTPTEIFTAWQSGADMIKIFPADQLGPAFIKGVRGPFPQIPLLPTGGVTLETIGDFAAAGATGFGIGSPLFNPQQMSLGNWDWVEQQTKKFSIALTNTKLAGPRPQARKITASRKGND